MPSASPADPQVTFVVPALNAEATLGACLEAIIAACTGDRGPEIFVLDNGSTDETATIAERHGAGVIPAADLTIAAVRNLGVSRARGEIIAFVDSDCLIAPDWLSRGLAHFTDPTVGAVGSSGEIPPDATWVQRTWDLHRHRAAGCRLVAWLPTGSVLIRKDAFEAIGGFNETLVTCEDADFCYRLGTRYRIVSDSALHWIHLGEDPTLGCFFLKNAWRARGNLAGLRAHGLHWSEIPSVLFPLYHLAWAGVLIGTLGYAAVMARVVPAIVATVMLLLPATMLAAVVAVRVKRLRCWPGLALLYLTYAAARAAAIVADFQRAGSVPAAPVVPKSHVRERAS